MIEVKNLRKSDFDLLFDAFIKLEEDIDIFNTRRMQKLVVPIAPPFSLKDALSHYTRDELHNIRKELGIKNASNLKKAEIIELLAEQLPYHLEQFFKITYEKHYKFLEKIYKKNGVVKASDLPRVHVEYLRQKGFLFYGMVNGEKVVTMPIELLNHFETLSTNFLIQAKIRKNTEWIKLMNGLLYYYGTLSYLDVHTYLEKYTNEKIDYTELYYIINEKLNFEDDDYYDYKGLTCGYVENSEWVREEQAKRSDLDYYPLTKQQILEAGEEDFVERNLAFTQFVHYLTNNYDISRVHAEEIVELYLMDIKNGIEPTDLLEYIKEQFEIPDKSTLEIFLFHINNLKYHSHQWILKGHIPMKLFAQEKKSNEELTEKQEKIVPLHTNVKIRRNELCPCGSGRKYKKCCGK